MESRSPLITLSSDFGVQSQGVGTMEAVAFSIAPHAKVIHLMHGLPEYDVTTAAWAMESLSYIPVGYHVCICDPGVGTDRKPIVCRVKRGDYLIGPDNGVLLPATRILGGIERVHEIANPKYMRHPVSPIFHGRDIFTPAAAHLACGIDVTELGPMLRISELVAAPYEEAFVSNGMVTAQVTQVNRFGSLRLNIRHEQWDSFGFSNGDTVTLRLKGHGEIKLKVGRTFADVPEQENLILKDDYGRIMVAKNKGSFIGQFPVDTGTTVEIALPN